MTKIETTYVTNDHVILLHGRIEGPLGRRSVCLMFDTGATITTIVPQVLRDIGYTEHDAVREKIVRTTVGREHGYEIKLDKLKVLGVNAMNMPVDVFDLAFDDIDGLIGMDFLSKFNFEVRPRKRRIFVELATRPSPAWL